MNWIENETKAAKFGDKRLNNRLQQVLSKLAHSPFESIPCNCQTAAETLAAYRFFDNHRVTPPEILGGHVTASLARIETQPVVLLAQDTTHLSFEREGEKLFTDGTLHKTEKESYWLHTTVALTPQRINLGMMHHEFWQRDENRPKIRQQKLPIEKKESMRWLRGYEVACAVQKRCKDTCVVSIADREGDIYDWFYNAMQQPLESKAEYIIRASANRRISTPEDDDVCYLWATMSKANVLGTYTLELARTPTRQARCAEIEVRAQPVSFCGPCHRKKTLPAVDMYAVYAREIAPPKDEAAVEWMLLTSLVTDTFATAQTVVAWYKARWEIELYFRTLKSGCQVEALRLETDTRLENALAIYLMIAWHLHNTTMLARETPNENCERLFKREEWRMIYALMRKPLPSEPPPLRDCVRTLAQVGGFLARKGDGEPGMKTVWRGYVRLLQALDTVDALSACRERNTYV